MQRDRHEREHRQQKQVRSGADPDVHVEIYHSVSPVDVDGYKRGEPKLLSCPHGECQASVFLDEDPSTPGWEEMDHAEDCPYRLD